MSFKKIMATGLCEHAWRFAGAGRSRCLLGSEGSTRRALTAAPCTHSVTEPLDASPPPQAPPRHPVYKPAWRNFKVAQRNHSRWGRKAWDSSEDGKPSRFKLARGVKLSQQRAFNAHYVISHAR